jgi:hypothetical protein
MKNNIENHLHCPLRPSSFLSINHRQPPHNNHCTTEPTARLPPCAQQQQQQQQATNMPPRDPNIMPEFKLIDGWHIAVSQPVYNPAALAIERARAAAAALPSGLKYIGNVVARAPAVYTGAGAPSVSEPFTATVENDCPSAVSDGYANIKITTLYGKNMELTLGE